MPVVVPVKFAYASRDLWFDPRDVDIVQADHAVCKTERGTEIGLVTADPFEVPQEELAAPLKPVLRVATEADLDRADELAQAGSDAMRDFRRLVKQNGLDMKPVGVEYLFGGERVVFYFAAEDRVDFRQLVRDLSSCFHARVDMRQIGVRDETRLVGGYAHCGQELCCARFGGTFEPVSIRMAKEQDLPLNSSKISGVCGRLMCCLRYEFEAYKDFKSRAPKKKALIDTPLGKARIVEYNTPREQLVLRLESGKVFRMDLADMTCSETAQKRSAEQGCACRPDCVTRDIMNRIESPEIKLALLELDRQNGVDVGDGLSSADRLEEQPPAQRRRRGRGEQAGGTSEHAASARGGKAGGSGASGKGAKAQSGKSRGQGAGPAGGAGSGASSRAAEGSASSRRRRRHTDAPAASDALAGDEGAPREDAAGSEQAASAAPRRRRHRAADETEAKAGAEAASGKQGAEGSPGSRTGSTHGAGSGSNAGGSRRRKHTSAGGSAAGGSATARSQKPDTRSVAEQVADGEVRVARRRPGDGGGAKGEPRADDAGAGAPAAQAGQDGGASSGQKRRRRRSRKPKQDSGGETAGGASGAASAAGPEA